MLRIEKENLREWHLFLESALRAAATASSTSSAVAARISPKAQSKKIFPLPYWKQITNQNKNTADPSSNIECRKKNINSVYLDLHS